MKRYASILTGLLLAFIGAAPAPAADFDDTHRFVFYAVLEGCYEDGLSSNDVAQILMKREDEFYFHFIYSCPLCMATLHALDVYRSRPPRFIGMKTDRNTFGPGLDADLKKQLYSEKTEDRLAAINTLVQGWIKRRTTMLRLTVNERAKLQVSLEAMRKKGMQALKTFVSSGQAAKMAPAYGAKDECSICNAAVGMALRPPEPATRP